MSPSKCPVCEGRGLVPGGFYTPGRSGGSSQETCRTCGGKGMVLAESASRDAGVEGDDPLDLSYRR